MGFATLFSAPFTSHHCLGHCHLGLRLGLGFSRFSACSTISIVTTLLSRNLELEIRCKIGAFAPPLS
ncbi:hypothetical protein TIFTF001_018592 [Ficus carica]|uniref:Uncharacterized protein n=1 Tax=Ficus carica TaxID=3494 RepID=A0AA88AS39_FICCA|nr:hypothetical protein TIFTF001_018592 [Ficus carica]